MTQVVPLSDAVLNSPAMSKLVSQRLMSAEDWIDRHASGTCRKNSRLGFAWKHQYLHERTAWEFGYVFDTAPTTRVTTGIPMSEGDCKPLTEAGWHIDRLLSRNPFPEDVYDLAYIQVASDPPREGVGVVLKETSASFVPPGHTVYGIIAEFDPVKKIWLDATPV